MIGLQSSLSCQQSVPETALLSGYKAAQPTATTRVGTRIGTNSNSTLSQLERKALGWTSEMLVKDNPIAGAYVKQRGNYCTSTIRYIPNTGDTVLDEEIRIALEGQDGAGGMWATMNDNGGMQGAFGRSGDIELPIYGDSALVWFRNGAGMLRLAEYSSDQIGEVYSVMQPRKTGLEYQLDFEGERILVEVSGSEFTYFCGRYFNRWMECVAYKMYERIDSWYGNPRIYDAKNVIFFQDPASLRGVRGVTIFANSIQYLDKGETLFQYGMDAALRQSKTAVAVYNGNGAPDEGTYESDLQYSGEIQYRERTGGSGPLAEYFFTGDKMEYMRTESPGPELIEGVDYAAKMAALGLGLTHSFLITAEKVGGAPSRLEIEKCSKEFTRIQNTIHRPRLNRIRDISILDLIQRREFRPYKGIMNGYFMLPISPTVDAFRDAKSTVMMFRSGLESPQNILAETNQDFNTVRRQKKEAAIAVAKDAQDANRELEAEGYDGTVTTNDIMQLVDNPQQQGSLNDQKGTDSNNQKLPTDHASS